MNVSRPTEPDRYARQVRFSAIGPEGQRRLGASAVLVVGCGALGAAAADLLARAGVGRLRLVDRDVVELSNLHRQLLFDEADATEGVPKAIAAARALSRINTSVKVEPVVADVGPRNVEPLLDGVAVVVDGTDNLETRYLLNDACVKRRLPWVYGGAVAATGMAMAIVPGETACFRCLYPTTSAAGMATCDTVGVLASTVVAVAAIQWTATVKLLLGLRDGAGELSALDVWTQDFEHTSIPRRPDCPCCVEGRFDYLEAKATSRTAHLCGRNAVQVSPAEPLALDLGQLRARLAGLGQVKARGDFALHATVDGFELTVFPDGRALVKGTDDAAVARALYARYVGG